MGIREAVAAAITEATGLPFQITAQSHVGGGDINESFRLDGGDGRRFFLKLNDARHVAMFVAEAAGLAVIAATNTLRVPQPVAHGAEENRCYLVLEYLDLGGSGSGKLLGEQLAALHRCTSDRFGFAQDNFIGVTPQQNTWTDDWITFWRERRLGFQLDLAAREGYKGTLQELGRELMQRLPEFFEGYAPQPSLLHGDLWGGNHGFLKDSAPVIFDPAAYYGDREADLAMTELFGGYGADFYAAYRASWPLHAGYARRKILYNLYHILNHANHFHGGYARQAEGMMRSLLGSSS